MTAVNRKSQDDPNAINRATRRSIIAGCRPLLDREFKRGWAMAAAHLMRAFDEPSMAYDILAHAGITTSADVKLLALESFDTVPLYAVLRSENLNGYRRK